jgi:hypothetical protein
LISRGRRKACRRLGGIEPHVSPPSNLPPGDAARYDEWRLNYAMTWSRKLLWIGALAPLAMFGCKDDGNGSGSGDTAATSAATDAGSGSADDGVDDGDATGTPPDCVEGTVGCVCLNSQCGNNLFCVDNMCALGPELDVDQPREVLAGLAVPMEMEVDAETFSWAQIGGPEVEILGADSTQIVVNLPPDLAPGDVIELEATAIRNTIEVKETTSITIIAPSFENFLGGITDPMQLGTSEGLAFSGNDTMWVVSSEGFVSVFDADGAFLERHEVPGQPVGANFNDENLIIANAGNEAVEQLNMVSGNVSTLFASVDGGGALGPVNYPVIDQGGNMYISNRTGGQVFRYDSEEGTVSVFLEGLLNPNALAFGPEGNNVLYVGTLGTVWRVAVEPGGVAGTPVPYLVLGPDTDITYEVDAITFDEGQTMWVGCPNAETLYFARYEGVGETAVMREFSSVGAGNSFFVNARFGRGDFGGSRLYWTNLAGNTVGRLQVGIGGL